MIVTFKLSVTSNQGSFQAQCMDIFRMKKTTNVDAMMILHSRYELGKESFLWVLVIIPRVLYNNLND